MSVRAKFKCVLKTETEGGGFTVLLRPVYGEKDDPNSENSQFYKLTPAGQVELSTINKNAAEQFVPGKSYYVDFSLADA